MSNLLCGRTTHPQRLIPGGFSKYPTLKELQNLRNRLKDALIDAEKIAGLFAQFADRFPDFERETEFIALTAPDEYAMYDGKIGSTLTESAEATEYLSFTNEYVVPTSTAKRAKHVRDSYMVGALARLNINFDKLFPIAKETANLLGLKPICYNPFMNNFAQLVEVVHNIEDSIRLTEEIESAGFNPHPSHGTEIKAKAGRGVSAVEVPRGILFHDYTYNDRGICTKANFVIPTNQNHGNIELDLKALVPQIMDKPRKDVDLTLEMLVRAYDPCISCSTHCIKVLFT